MALIARKKLKPGQNGTKRLVEKYGDKLVCVRYRYDEEQCIRHTTVELIVESRPWRPAKKKISEDAIVGIKIRFDEMDLRLKVKRAGGRWDRAKRLWHLRYDKVLALRLKSRIDRSTLPQDSEMPNSIKK